MVWSFFSISYSKTALGDWSNRPKALKLHEQSFEDWQACSCIIAEVVYIAQRLRALKESNIYDGTFEKQKRGENCFQLFGWLIVQLNQTTPKVKKMLVLFFWASDGDINLKSFHNIWARQIKSHNYTVVVDELLCWNYASTQISMFCLTSNE